MSEILVVDDDSSVCDLLSGLLQDAGYQVDMALNEREAVEKIVERNYHIVIADMVMESPKSGLEVLRVAKEKDPLTQVIVLTAYGSISNAVESMELGAFTYLEKKGVDIEEYNILRNQVQLALAYKDSMAYAAGDLTRGIDSAVATLAAVVSQIQECVAQLNTAVRARERLLGHLRLKSETKK